ncbi:MAG: MFS transporter [Deltaproteobacteria bacterium]|nr:MFS transporter [Deltaproteobacteria bacterium]
MVLPLLPAFLAALGAGAFALGWIEGLAEAVASVLKLASGRWADRLGRSRPFVVAGYSLSSLVRPLVALAAASWHVLAVRVVDRVGKGLRTSPRDALIAASVDPADRGAAFGLHRAMDHTGAVLGPLLAAAFLTFWSSDLRSLFWLTAIPDAGVILLVALGVREAPAAAAAATAPAPSATPGPAARPRRALATVLVPVGIFTLGNASDVFLLLKAGAVHAPLVSLPLLWMGLHVVKALLSVPGGRLADRWGRRRTIALGWLVYAAVYLGFAFAQTRAAVVGLFLVYGAYHGLAEGPEKALVADLAPRGRGGTTFGWFHLTQGLLALAASVLFGSLWEWAGSAAAFITSAALAAVAVVLLGVLGRQRAPASQPHSR